MVPSLHMDARSRQSGRKKRFMAMALFVAALSALVYLWNPVEKTQADELEARSCGKAKTLGAFRAFVAAYNRGDSAALDRRFAPEPDFRWYSSGAPGRRVGNAAGRRRTLIRYFAKRHASGDRIRIRRLDYNGRSSTYGNLGFEILRRSDGFRGGGWIRVPGKGAASCYDGEARFIVMSIGSPIAGPGA